MKIDWRRLRAGPSLFTPGGLLLGAGTLLAVYLAVEALGLRDYTTVFTGTPVSGKTISRADTSVAGLYTTLYLVVVFAVPVMVIAAGLFAAARHWAGRRGSASPCVAKPGFAEQGDAETRGRGETDGALDQGSRDRTAHPGRGAE